MPTRTREFAKFLYRHTLIRYIVVGGTTFILDFGLLIFFHQDIKMVLWLATFLANFIALTYNFLLNRFWAFSARDMENLRQHIMLYVVIVGINLLFSVLFVSIVGSHISYKVAKVMAVAIQTLWTYPVYKNYIFIKPTEISGSSENI